MRCLTTYYYGYSSWSLGSKRSQVCTVTRMALFSIYIYIYVSILSRLVHVRHTLLDNRYLLEFGTLSPYVGYDALNDHFPSWQLAPNPHCSSSWCIKRQISFKVLQVTMWLSPKFPRPSLLSLFVGILHKLSKLLVLVRNAIA